MARASRRLLALASSSLVGALLVSACVSEAPPPPAPIPQPAPPPPPTVQPVAETPDAGAVATLEDGGLPDGAVAAAPASGPAACPDDMVLVDGDYCTDVETKCLKSHYAKQNKKTICEQFEESSKCVGKKEHRRYCIDKYEYPNKKGELPITMNDFPHAQKLCAGLKKRVCTETEWTMACEGPSYKPYPYGFARDPEKCRGDRPYRFPSKQGNGLLLTHSKNKAKAEAELKRLYDAVPSGSQPACVSDYGVWDMPGNADELAASETKAPKSKYDNVTTGGPWLEGVRNQCRPKIYDHNEGFSYYYLSFRCCAEPDGKPTDPRSPKQIQRNEAWKP